MIIVSIVLFAFAFVIACYKVKGFDAAVYNAFALPVWNFLCGVASTITSHPIWQSWMGYAIAIGGTFMVTMLAIYRLVPRIRQTTATPTKDYMGGPAEEPTILKQSSTTNLESTASTPEKETPS